MDLGISMAATNAVTAANNVTQNLNTTILQLQSAVDGVKHVVDDVAAGRGRAGGPGPVQAVCIHRRPGRWSSSPA